MSLGERFRAAREQRGLTLSEVAEHLRIRSVYLAAIEEENWSVIGAPVYTRGFLRTYARYLNLDPEEAVASYNERSGAPPAGATPTPPSQRVRASGDQAGTLRPILWIAGVIAVALIAFVVYLYVTPPGGKNASAGAVAGASPGPVATAAQPSTEASATPAAEAPPVHTLAVFLTAPSWLRVSVDGNVSMEGTFPAGTRRTFHGASALVRVGNAGGVQITVDGRPVGKLGASGDVIEKTFIL